MAIYQTSKQLTKFGIVGISAVCVDAIIYYILSQFLDVNISKALGFLSGTFVTYNLNKYWTWRQTDKSTMRLFQFVLLYLASMLINVGVNSLALEFIPNTNIIIALQTGEEAMRELIPMKADKFIAFFIATAVSSVFNFIGQKYWVFKEKDVKEETSSELPVESGEDTPETPESQS